MSYEDALYPSIEPYAVESLCVSDVHTSAETGVASVRTIRSAASRMAVNLLRNRTLEKKALDRA